jgi:hypothetical protein
MPKVTKMITNDAIRNAIKKKSIQSTTASICSHCGIEYQAIGVHRPVCIMNPERKPRNTFVTCDTCGIAFLARNINRHIPNCDGNAENSLNGILQNFRSEYLRVMRGGIKVTKSDSSLGYGNRTVPELVRKNVENDLHLRGMSTDWTITPTLRIMRSDDIIFDDAIEVTVINNDFDSIIASVINLINDEESMARVLNVIINNATYKLAQDKR